MDQAEASKALPDEVTFKSMSEVEQRRAVVEFLERAISEKPDHWARGDIDLAMDAIQRGHNWDALELSIRAFTPEDGRQKDYTGPDKAPEVGALSERLAAIKSNS